MPSFASLLKLSRREIDGQDRKNLDNTEDGNNGKLQRGQTRRDFFRRLLKRSSSGSESNQRRGQFVGIVHQEVPSPTSPNKPTTPMDPNKPLPRPPAPGNEPELVVRPTKKLERIITPLVPSDLHKLFSGAPQFFARSEAYHTGASYPSVAFPWDVQVEIRDLCDHLQLHDEAWSSVSAWSHITMNTQKNLKAVKEQRENQMAHFVPQCREKPNMISMQGLERGTIGYQAALEMGIADALRIQDEKASEGSLSERRRQFLTDKDGLRPLTEATVVELLTNASTTYHDNPAKHSRPTIELYTELFTQILFPPSRVTDSEDPYSLQVQIEVLIDVLGSSGVWFDFSLVEWRIRLGQILWAPLEDDIVVNGEVAEDQKYWLLLQVLLSCELLMRLDAVSANIDHGIEEPKGSDLHHFDKKSTPIVKWSLILARLWLENIKIEAETLEVALEMKPPSGWLSSFTSSAPPKDTEVQDTIKSVQFYGRHQTRQLSGLLHFARKLGWPNIEQLESKISESGITISESKQGTPVAGTPRSVSTLRTNSYFSSRPGVGRNLSKQRMSAMIHPQGWLSNSYVSGLILPGEGISHFLISTLLENDEEAFSRLGGEVNLYGGFSYSNKSFWSTSCIVGRVLAAGAGAADCIGWVASDVTPRGLGEAWVEIDVELTSQSEPDKDAKPRIWHKSAIERDGDIIGGADLSSVLPGDFILPSDEPSHLPLSIELQSLDLFAETDSVHTTPTKETPTPLSDISQARAIRTYGAMMRFSVAADGEKKKEINLALSHDVYFVTAFPCVSSSHTDLLKSPRSPSFQILEQSRSGSSGTLVGHPLHKAFRFTKISLSTILSMPPSLPFTSLLSPPQSPNGDPSQSTTHTTNSPIPKVLVVDCTESAVTPVSTRPTLSPHSSAGNKRRVLGSDGEILARALCAERGWNALISRRDRGCLSCSIREASALGFRVVLRFE